jgi:linoleoyl-CoA desaturase
MRYQSPGALHTDLRRRVNRYFRETGLSRYGNAGLRWKGALMVTWLVASYVALVFWASTPLATILLTVSLGVAVAGVGFNIQHDGSHRSYAGARWKNRLAGLSLDLIGGSSYVWHYMHNVLHHHHPNVDGADRDLEAGPLLRLAPSQPWRRVHRLQHLYIWLLYGFIPVKWQFYEDFRYVVLGRLGELRMPRPRGGEAALFVLGKALLVLWVIVVPLWRHSVVDVVLVYCLWSLICGNVMAVVFQLAHVQEDVRFGSLAEDGRESPDSWCRHQLATTVDFCGRNRFLTWFLGGLNFQVEHHLFPAVSHVHYPAIAPIVEEVCREHGAPYHSHDTLRDALGSHVRTLRSLGTGSRTA